MPLSSKTARLTAALSLFLLTTPGAFAVDPSINAEATARTALPLPVIPLPREAKSLGGKTNLAHPRLELPAGATDTRLATAAERLREAFGKNASGARIRLVLAGDKSAAREAYRLVIDGSGATITATDPQGLLYGATTLAQMGGLARGPLVPRVQFDDAPNLAYRGVMHDIGRGFIEVDLLKRHIERMSRYKVNVFHWHLTENPAWRFEVKAHPELVRAEFHEKPNAPGKHYTQEQMRDVIAFAKARGVTVVPEIDIPGHTGALRRALGVKSMSDPKVAPVIRDAFSELLALASPEDMPYIHVGTDEVRSEHEKMSEEFIAEIIAMITKTGRKAIVWNAGMKPPENDKVIEMMWAQFKPSGKRPFIDARSIYTNLNTGADAVRTTYWNMPATDGKAEHRYGGTLAQWLDIPTAGEDVDRVSPFWPAVVTFADRCWRGGAYREDLLVTLPPEGTPEARAYQAFENAVIAHRDTFFRGAPFAFVREDGFWKLLGPIPNDKNKAAAFGPEKNWAKPVPVTAPDGKTYGWDHSARGWQIFVKHMFGWAGAMDNAPELSKNPWRMSYPRPDRKDTTVYARAVITSDADKDVGFWIQVDPPNVSDRREGPNPKQGEWNRDGAKIWINGAEVKPPVWKTPDTGSRFAPPLSDEYCYLRPEAVKVRLKRGDNVVLLRLPEGGYKWEFVCHPVEWDGVNVREAKGVTFKKW